MNENVVKYLTAGAAVFQVDGPPSVCGHVNRIVIILVVFTAPLIPLGIVPGCNTTGMVVVNQVICK